VGHRVGGQREREVVRPEAVDPLEHGFGDRAAAGIRDDPRTGAAGDHELDDEAQRAQESIPAGEWIRGHLFVVILATAIVSLGLWVVIRPDLQLHDGRLIPPTTPSLMRISVARTVDKVMRPAGSRGAALDIDSAADER
jgi:hypothetical protein